MSRTGMCHAVEALNETSAPRVAISTWAHAIVEGIVSEVLLVVEAIVDERRKAPVIG